MSELGDLFKDWKEHKKGVRLERAIVNLEYLKKEGIKAEFVQDGVFRVGKVMYYPGSNSWQFKSKVFRGDIESFKNWLMKQELLTSY